MELIRTDDFEAVKAAYIDVIDHTPGIENHAHWVYGRHPSDESLREYIAGGEMYALKDGKQIAGTVVIVMHQGKEYEPVQWGIPLASDKVATLHLLAVCPAYRGRALGSLIIEKAKEIARQNGKKALRLDTLETNLPAQRMYEKAGLSHRGNQHWYAENTGWMDFRLYEFLL